MYIHAYMRTYLVMHDPSSLSIVGSPDIFFNEERDPELLPPLQRSLPTLILSK